MFENFNIEQFSGYLATGIIGASFAYLKKIVKDINASFRKLRDIEDTVKELKEWKKQSEQKS